MQNKDFKALKRIGINRFLVTALYRHDDLECERLGQILSIFMHSVLST